MKMRIRWLTIPALVMILAVVFFYAPQNTKKVSSATPGNKVLAQALAVELGQAQQPAKRQFVSSGVLYALLQGAGVLDQRARNSTGPALLVPGSLGTQGCQNKFLGLLVDNIRVNQDCSLRRQAEEVVVANPNNSLNLIAGQNDSRLGFNKCGYDWSKDGGRTWGDQIPPFYQFVNLDGRTFDACSDPTATFDSMGNAYIGGVLFEINFADSAFLVEKSNNPIGGAYYHSPAPGAFQVYLDNPPGVVANDNDPNIFNDKEFIVADNTVTSPKSNFVYATWTRFNAATGAGVGANSPIYFSQSKDGGATWSKGIEISGANAAICTAFSGEADPNACDQDQGSHPVVGHDGTVFVAFGNGNTSTAGVNQHLFVKCGPADDCTNPASWSEPVKISDDIGIQPVGPASTGCPSGRQCLPPNGYRLDDFVEGSLSVDDSGKLYFAWADGRNIAATCQGNAATATPPCNNDVFYSFSTDEGATWSSPFNLTAASRFGQTAQWMPWSAVMQNGKTLFVAFYDREYGNCETTGCNDITLARVVNPTAGTPAITYQRITTGSMPNLTPANNPVQAGFLGDYMWVSVDSAGRPLIVWADTRGQNRTVEEDVYFARFHGTP